MGISNKPDQLDKKPSDFINIWRRNETRLSALIAQTILLSPNFRRFIAGKLNIENKSFKITSIHTEHSFENNKEEKIDILIKCSDGLLIGIENKIWASLQGDDQLIRYDKLLNEESKGHYRLVLLAPSSYKLPYSSEPKNTMKRIDYRQICNWIASESFESGFEENYFKQLRLYLNDLRLEIKPFTRQEIKALKEKNPDAINKLIWIISSIKPETANLNHSAVSGYSLYGLDICSFPVYVGFRYSSYTDWFREELLQSQPECLIYIQDNWNDDEFNRRIGQVYNELKHQAEQPHDRKKKRECRLSIRKSLLDFEGKEISEIVLWFEENLNLLKKAIEKVTNDDIQDSKSSIL